MSRHNFLQRLWFGEAMFLQAFWVMGFFAILLPDLTHAFLLAIMQGMSAWSELWLGRAFDILRLILLMVWLIVLLRHQPKADYAWSAWLGLAFIILFTLADARATGIYWVRFGAQEQSGTADYD